MGKDELIEPAIKLWLQKEGEDVGGEGKIGLLEAIEEEGSLNKGAEKIGMSYRYAWDLIRELEDKLDYDLVKSEKGGVSGGGSSLTEQGRSLVRRYRWMKETLDREIKGSTFWENLTTKISARNRLRGRIEEKKIGEVGAKIKLKVEPSEMTAFITREAAEDMNLEEGESVEAVIKATEVMISKKSKD